MNMDYYHEPNGWPERIIAFVLGLMVVTLALILVARWIYSFPIWM